MLRAAWIGKQLNNNLASARGVVILPRTHPYEYFSNQLNAGAYEVKHPEPAVQNAPLYYKITLTRSLLGMPWNKRYEAGILFKIYSPKKRYKPKSVKPNISCNTVIFREASPEVAELVYGLKELVKLENVWTEDQYKREAKEVLKSKAMSSDEQQELRGYQIIQK
ncbi:hypothetical protein MIR68_009310 [Amoeboaphelidium protococcarum]|nr:hypothetical protein MIR68_009310 [Amoeboaphelidium protococcarum]KAI3645937.1 hypothetical protein MP228_008865 [Amoeboaphelidium protococcarum]